MRLLNSTLLPIRRLVPSSEGLITITFVGLLAAMEVVGRSTTRDVQDGFAGLVLVAGVSLLMARHRREPIRWLDWIGRRLSRVSQRFDRLPYDHGIDLRGSSDIPNRLPPLVYALLGGLAVWATLAGLAWYCFPNGWRELGTNSSYVVYVVLLLALWAGLATCTLAGLYSTILFLDRWLLGSLRTFDRWLIIAAILGTYVGFMAGLATIIPTVVVLVFCLGVSVFALASVLRGERGEPAILWRDGEDAPIYAIPIRRLALGVFGIAGIVLFDLLLSSTGGHMLEGFNFHDFSGAMVITTSLGTLAAWMIPGTMLMAWIRFWMARHGDPAHRTPPTIHIQGDRSMQDKQTAAHEIEQWGWRSKLAPAKGLKLGVQLVDDARSEAREFDPIWPLKLSLNDLRSTEVRERLVRRDEIQLRRRAFRGMSKLFKQAFAERKRKGGGYLFAPHWWFITGLDRDDATTRRDDRPELARVIGPQYQQAFGRRVRQQFHQVLRALEVDMIYLEDGVRYRSFVKVMRMLFELYDRNAGERRAEDLMFQGIPKVRVILHEYAHDKPFRTSDYVEPQFNDLSRARVLHIFRDHGDHEERVEEPFDHFWEPSDDYVPSDLNLLTM